MDQFDQLLEIRLDDGRAIIAKPRPEDQDLLRQAGREVTLELGSSEFDTAAHGVTSDLTIDVEGHAMTLRLPTPADAEALRRMLMVGAMSATIVTAGALASMQPHSVPSAQTIVNRGPVNAPAQNIEQVREERLDQMLQAPPAIGQPSDIATDDAVHSAPAIGADSVSASQVAPAPIVRPDTRSDDFTLRREQAADELLAAPPADAPAAPGSANSSRVGGPQD